MAFQIQYGRSRFPIRQKRDDGTFGCRGCGSDIPKGRQTWCSSACVEKHEPRSVLEAVRKRDKGVCQRCSFDLSAARKEWRLRKPDSYGHEYRTWLREEPQEEYDHIIPFSEGGLTVLENMRTLCHKCHVQVTTEWRRSKKRNGQSQIQNQLL